MNFTNRNIIVTGGANGIGSAIVEAFLAQGGRVVFVDMNQNRGEQRLEELRQRYQDVHFAHANVANFAECEHVLAQAQSWLGPIDTLVNNAGISPKTDGRGLDIERLTVDEWRQVVDVNLHGSFNLTKLVVPDMKAQQFGRIVSMSSVAAKAYLDVCAAHYSATKAAIIGLTRHLAGELGPYGINVNAIAPGRIDTDMVAMAGPIVNQKYIDDTPLRRLGKPSEVADLCLYLCSEKEAGFITGQVVDAAGGWLMT